ncbi:MAG: hypothetical protein ABL986_20925 [Vicinamibacterales bacterium]
MTNVRGLGGQTSIALKPGCQLRRATAAEVAFIKQTAQRLGALAWFPQPIWEIEWKDGAGKALPESKWRYFVIAFMGSNEIMEDVRAAGHIARGELDCAFTAIHAKMRDSFTSGWTQHSLRLVNDLWEFDDEKLFIEITHERAAELASLCSQIAAHDSSGIDVRQHALALGDLKTLHWQSKLRFLGRFAILESLLTHPPKPSDPADSLTRQIVSKIALLDNRWKHRLDYARFDGAVSDRVWKAMYAYRSAAAHGDKPDFKKDLKVLKSANDASALLQDAVKAVLRHALAEPQLMLDLKRC